MDYCKLLNKQQLAPVMDTEGAMLILAGAGSGKTRVLTYRIAYLIKEMGISPYNILAITFTNKAAGEMKARVCDLVGTNNVTISTFHAFCVKILRWEISNLQGYKDNFSIYDDSDCGKIITRILRDMSIEDSKQLKKDIRWHISNAKNHGLDAREYALRIKSEQNAFIISSVFSQYENILLQNNALDFDDLLLKVVVLFSKRKDILEKYQDRFRYMMVDEFQDTNKIQYKLIRLLGAKYGNVFVVGDDDQSIYGWRWAEVANISNFQKHFLGARIYKLEQNYRSSSNILNLANKIISNNDNRMGKTLWTECDKGVSVVYRSNWDEKGEADYVLGEINSLIKHNGYTFGDFAILVRANSISRAFEDKLALYSYPYKVIGGNKFYDRKEIKDFLAYLKFLSNPNDNESILRVINFPKRGIGDGAIDKLMQACNEKDYSLVQGILNLGELNIPSLVYKKISLFADVVIALMEHQSKPLQEFIDYANDIIDWNSAYDIKNLEDSNRLDNISDFVESVKEYCVDNENANLQDYLQSVSLISDNETIEEDNCITLATIHGAKGLEYRCVFIVGLEEGIFPSIRKDSAENEIQEERRIMYVAITRAKERLYLTNAQSRFRFGKRENGVASRFLEECDVIKYRVPTADGDVDFAPRKPKFDFSKISQKAPAPFNNQSVKTVTQRTEELGKFAVGMLIKHTKFGIGEIMEITGENAKIKFEGLGVKVFNLRLAPIEICQ